MGYGRTARGGCGTSCVDGGKWSPVRYLSLQYIKIFCLSLSFLFCVRATNHYRQKRKTRKLYEDLSGQSPACPPMALGKQFNPNPLETLASPPPPARAGVRALPARVSRPPKNIRAVKNDCVSALATRS